uniref:Palmitoyltransferase n=1 Tax=Chromera velia CCMP2878 TaxID=1169474 RepID=A0A0G4F025_9ALVE|eukprot:Cvel_2563.t1-p1 / transcript=Cvel_2563.t1 / gene=Cvel_2563 / organism=Chromera_velia_CCMP2878 / gene_product=Probable S-acyltransferase At3g56930, putative / transcript_product=Probable S-acyltransferase At3g56930, putative / location=Cvel_scaffold101:86770-88987(+) / protein_length=424 / sequence_SO=supercontig / SO=protein_coding / is_pseudo=false
MARKGKAGCCGGPYVDEGTKRQWTFFRFLYPFLVSYDDVYPSYWITMGLFLFPHFTYYDWFLIPWFWDHVPLTQDQWPTRDTAQWLCLLFPILTVLAVIFGTLVVAIDPGILPPACPKDVRENKPKLPEPSGNMEGPNCAQRKVQLSTGWDYKATYCNTCKIWRPLRAKHCDWCGVCVRRYDHHCPWLSKDIGLRNHGWFLIWLYIANACLITGMVLDIAVLTQEFLDNHLVTVFAAAPFWPVLTLFFFYKMGFLGFMGMLMMQHTRMALNNENTRERSKKEWKRDKPWQRGCCYNLYVFFQGMWPFEISLVHDTDPDAMVGSEDMEETMDVFHNNQIKNPDGTPVEFKTAYQLGYHMLEGRGGAQGSPLVQQRGFGGGGANAGIQMQQYAQPQAQQAYGWGYQQAGGYGYAQQGYGQGYGGYY